MNFREFRRAGHFPSLLCAFLYFDISFMIWVLLGPLANRIVGELMPQAAGEGGDDYLVRVAPYKGLMGTATSMANPGLGNALFHAIQTQDFATVRAFVFLGALLIQAGYIATDICYALVDPRIRFK